MKDALCPLSVGKLYNPGLSRRPGYNRSRQAYQTLPLHQYWELGLEVMHLAPDLWQEGHNYGHFTPCRMQEPLVVLFQILCPWVHWSKTSVEESLYHQLVPSQWPSLRTLLYARHAVQSHHIAPINLWDRKLFLQGIPSQKVASLPPFVYCWGFHYSLDRGGMGVFLPWRSWLSLVSSQCHLLYLF